MCYDYLSIIYANDCARSVRLANRRRSALFRTRGSSVLPSGLLCSAQRIALCCSAACSVLYDAAQQHQTEPSAPLPCLFLPSLPFPAFLAFPCFLILPFSFPFPFFSFLFSLKSFCPLLLLPIFFALSLQKPKKQCLPMDEETLKQKLMYAGPKIASMNRRLEGHDYQARQIYLITMCVERRRPLFGEMVGDVRQPLGAPDAPRLSPSALGEAIIENWQGMLARIPEMKGIVFQLMPDHFHGILFVTERLSRSLGKILNGFKVGCRHDYLALCPEEYAADKLRQHQDENRQDRRHGILYEANYNDKVLLREGQLNAWIRYVMDNPRRLLVKREHPEFFRVQRSLEWKGMTFSALGNRFLLRKPFYIQIQCSRSLTEQQIEAEKAKALALYRQGAILVSPSISPGE